MIIITKVKNNRIIKYLPVTADNANDILNNIIKDYPDAFIYDGEYVPTLWVDNFLVSSKENIVEKTQEHINSESRAYLNNTDWYVVRFAETGVAIPQEILDARQAARDSIVDNDLQKVGE